MPDATFGCGMGGMGWGLVGFLVFGGNGWGLVWGKVYRFVFFEGFFFWKKKSRGRIENDDFLYNCSSRGIAK